MNTDTMIGVLQTLNAGNNAFCQKCRADNPEISNALGPWLSCDKSNYGNGIAFVGKIARGDDMGHFIADSLKDINAAGNELIRENHWAYWSYTRSILECVFGSLERALPFTSFTNLIKCNNSTTEDTSSASQVEYCVLKNRFALKELEIVMPRVIIFYTGTAYDQFIKDIKPKTAASFVDESDEDARIIIGQKTLPWWTRKYYCADGSLLTCYLRVGHPERMKKDEYVENVAAWIQQSLNAFEGSKLSSWRL